MDVFRKHRMRIYRGNVCIIELAPAAFRLDRKLKALVGPSQRPPPSPST